MKQSIILDRHGPWPRDDEYMKSLHQKITSHTKRVVIKIGSGLVTHDGGLNSRFFHQLSREIHRLRSKRIEVVLVSSGAIACGMHQMGLKKRPKNLPQKQAVAAIGQPQLMNLYSRVLKKYNLQTAQILLTKADIENKTRSLNARHALMELMKEKVIPIINENDSVAVDEIKVGDNDQLSAMVAQLIRADLLVILTDIDGLYDADPRKVKSAKRIPLVTRLTPSVMNLAKDTGSEKSTGGMITKLKAAQYTLTYGIPTWIVKGIKPSILSEMMKGKEIGTLFAN